MTNSSLPDINSMTMEEIAAEREKIRFEREELEAAAAEREAERDRVARIEQERSAARRVMDAPEVDPFADPELPQDAAPENSDGPEPAPWPHQVIEFKDMLLEVRKPKEAALVAVSMTGTAGISPEDQLRIFSRFLSAHMSPSTFMMVLSLMMDPDSDLSIQEIVTAMATM